MQGFDISEVIQGNLLLKEAVMPIIWREAQWEADTALRLLAELDARAALDRHPGQQALLAATQPAAWPSRSTC